MRITPVENLNAGDLLGKSLFDTNGDLLLASGHHLDEKMIDLLKKHQVRYVYTLDDVTKDIVPEDVITDTVRRLATHHVSSVMNELKEREDLKSFDPKTIREKITKDSIFNNAVNIDSIRTAVFHIVNDIVDHNIQYFAALPASTMSGADHEHAMNTALLSIVLGRSFNFDASELRKLGTAALLHDIGKMLFPELRELSFDDMNMEQRAIIREHPIHSKLLLQKSSVDTYIEQAVVLQHHEYQDGSGYPQGLKGTGEKPEKNKKYSAKFIHRFAEIVAVANHYDNLLTGSFNGFFYSPSDAVMVVMNDAGTLWNQHVALAFVNNVQSYPVGLPVKIVRNASGEYVGYSGVIAVVNTEEPTKPVIVLTHNSMGASIIPKKVDFKDERSMILESLI